MVVLKEVLISKKAQPLTACKQYCLAAGATQGNIAYTQNVIGMLASEYCFHKRKFEI